MSVSHASFSNKGGFHFNVRANCYTRYKHGSSDNYQDPTMPSQTTDSFGKNMLENLFRSHDMSRDNSQIVEYTAEDRRYIANVTSKIHMKTIVPIKQTHKKGHVSRNKNVSSRYRPEDVQLIKRVERHIEHVINAVPEDMTEEELNQLRAFVIPNKDYKLSVVLPRHICKDTVSKYVTPNVVDVYRYGFHLCRNHFDISRCTRESVHKTLLHNMEVSETSYRLMHELTTYIRNTKIITNVPRQMIKYKCSYDEKFNNVKLDKDKANHYRFKFNNSFIGGYYDVKSSNLDLVDVKTNTVVIKDVKFSSKVIPKFTDIRLASGYSIENVELLNNNLELITNTLTKNMYEHQVVDLKSNKEPNKSLTCFNTVLSQSIANYGKIHNDWDTYITISSNTVFYLLNKLMEFQGILPDNNGFAIFNDFGYFHSSMNKDGNDIWHDNRESLSKMYSSDSYVLTHVKATPDLSYAKILDEDSVDELVPIKEIKYNSLPKPKIIGNTIMFECYDLKIQCLLVQQQVDNANKTSVVIMNFDKLYENEFVQAAINKLQKHSLHYMILSEMLLNDYLLDDNDDRNSCYKWAHKYNVTTYKDKVENKDVYVPKHMIIQEKKMYKDDPNAIVKIEVNSDYVGDDKLKSKLIDHLKEKQMIDYKTFGVILDKITPGLQLKFQQAISDYLQPLRY